MRAVLVFLCNIVALGSSQSHYQQPSQNAAILSDARYLSGDGTFGAAYTQEDGVEFKEESDEYGNRKGSYSYVDPTGQRRTVTYTAGVNGFQASGDHIPSAPPPTPPQPEYVPLPQYNPPDYQPPESLAAYYRPRSVERQPPPPRYAPQYAPRYRPREHQYQEETSYVPRTPAPAPAVQHRYAEPKPAQYQHQKYVPQYQATEEPLFVPRLLSESYRRLSESQPQYEAPVPKYRPAPAPPAQYQSKFRFDFDNNYQKYEGQAVSKYRPAPRPAPRPVPHYNDITTPAPRKFYPPGKLDFNRTPDGFSYTFSKN